MIFPTAVGTVAAALQIIDYLIKFGRFMSSDVETALNQTRVELLVVDPSSSAEVAEQALKRNLNTVMTENEARLAEGDLGHVIEVLNAGFFQHMEEAKERETIPNYSAALGKLVDAVRDKLSRWGGFPAWGEQILFERKKRREERALVLPLPNTTHALKRCNALFSAFRVNPWGASAFFMNRTGGVIITRKEITSDRDWRNTCLWFS
ncbi:MAG: hypothetical protein K8S97_11910 [Anaerolineae bacterium]|nr:hypothetical protein [Anaerolineae bacterium]